MRWSLCGDVSLFFGGGEKSAARGGSQSFHGNARNASDPTPIPIIPVNANLVST